MPRQRGGVARRSSSGGGGGFFSKRSSPPPAPAPSSPPPAVGGGGGGGFLSNMAGNVASGMASGVGFGVAQRAVDAVMGPRSMEVVHSNQSVPGSAAATPLTESAPRNLCQTYMEDLNECMKRHTDITLCQNHLDALKACQTNYA